MRPARLDRPEPSLDRFVPIRDLPPAPRRDEVLATCSRCGEPRAGEEPALGILDPCPSCGGFIGLGSDSGSGDP